MPEQPASPPLPAVRLRFTPILRDVLMDVVGRVNAAQAAAPAAHAPPGAKPGEQPDLELAAAWSEGLREREDHDSRAFLSLVMNPKFGLVDIPVAPAMAEALARASLRVRLYLRETVLRGLTTEQSQGDVDVFGLPAAEQQGYACFHLLAHLEEDLIEQLDPGAAWK